MSQFWGEFPEAVINTFQRLQIALIGDIKRCPLSSPLFPELSKLDAHSQHHLLASFELPKFGGVTPSVMEQLHDAESELAEAKARLLRERLHAVANKENIPYLGDCMFYDAPGISQEELLQAAFLEAPTPEWESERIRPLWPKDEWFRDAQQGPYPEDYGSIPLGDIDTLCLAFDALVEEHWMPIYLMISTFATFQQYGTHPLLLECVQSAGSLIPACMMTDHHLQPTGDRQADKEERQDYADSQDSIQSMGDFWKEFYSKDSGKKIPDSHKSRLANDPNKVGFTKSALFHKQPLAHSLAQTWANFRGTQDKADLVKVTMDMNIEKYTVRLPDAVRTTAGPLYIEWINLPRMSENSARKLAEAGWNNADICGVDLAVKSHVAVGTPVRVIISLVDGACSDMPTATMCAFEVNLATQNNRSLNLPLLSLPFSQLLADLHDFQHRVKIACQFRDPEGFNVGTPMLSFSSLEFSELKQTAFERKSLLRDSWSEIEKRACHGGGRCIASQGIVQTWEKEINPPLKEYAPLVLPPVPQPRRNFIGQQSGEVVKPWLPKSRSMRFKSPTDLWSRPSVDGGSTSTVVTGTEHLRCDDVPGCAYEVDPLHLLYYASVDVPKDTLEGTRLARIDLRAKAQEMDSAVWRQWVKEGCMKPRIKIRISAATSCFSGVVLGMCLDAYRRIPIMRDKGFSANLVTGLPNTMWATRTQAELEWDLDLSQECGHSFYALSDTLGYMDFLIYVLRGNEMTAVADWSFYVAFYVDWSQESFTAMLAPTLKWPPTPGIISTFKEVRGPYAFSLDGTKARLDFGFLPGVSLVEGSETVRTCPRVLASFYRSWTGKLRISIEEVSSIFLTGSYMVGVAWNAGDDLGGITTRKHWMVKSGEIFDLDLYGPHGEYPTFAGKANGTPYIVVQKVGGIVGPKDSTGSFGFFLHIHGMTGIYKNPTLHSPERGQMHAWFRMNNIQVDNLSFSIPGRIEDMSALAGSYDITNYVNPASLLFSVTGLHGGTIRLHVTWCPKTNLGESKGTLKYMQYLYHTNTVSYYGDQATRGLIDPDGFKCELRCGDFFGATNIAMVGDVERLAIHSANATFISEIRVSFEILEMSFYGKTIKVS
uniref:Polyprotein 2 n=1 Tax=Raspberry ringspot virus TaxID=12809 RepID=Q24M89_9SECO|nr:polyprotein 2 [Raspberry ringspot virus]